MNIVCARGIGKLVFTVMDSSSRVPILRLPGLVGDELTEECIGQVSVDLDELPMLYGDEISATVQFTLVSVCICVCVCVYVLVIIKCAIIMFYQRSF